MSAPSKHGREEYDDRDRPSKRATADNGQAAPQQTGAAGKLPTDMARLIASFTQMSPHRTLSDQNPNRQRSSELAGLATVNKAWQADLRRPLQTELQINTANYLDQLRWIGKWTERYKGEPMPEVSQLNQLALIHDTVGAMGTELVVPTAHPKSDLFNKPAHYRARAAAWMTYTGATQEQLLAFRSHWRVGRHERVVGWWSHTRTYVGGYYLLSARSDTDGTPLDAILSLCGGEFTLDMRSHLELLLGATATVFGWRIAQELLVWMIFMQQFDVFPELGESTSVDFPHVVPDVWGTTTTMRLKEDEQAAAARMQQ